MKHLTLSGAVFLALVSRPHSGISQVAPDRPADLAIVRANVVTVDGKFSVTNAVAARDGKIVALGDEVAKKIGPATN